MHKARLGHSANRKSKGRGLVFPYRGVSMHGTFRYGDTLIVTPVAIQDLRRGDVVAFHAPKTTFPSHKIAHRVQARTTDGLITRGDQCDSTDPTIVTAQNLIGRVSAVEREGETRPVLGGWWGRAWAVALRIWRRIAPAAGWPYRCFRSTGLARSLWHPPLAQVRLETDLGPMIKYVHRGRTVARWWPVERKFWCRKPYDLVLAPPDRHFD